MMAPGLVKDLPGILQRFMRAHLTEDRSEGSQVTAALRTMFDELDTDHSGQLSEPEVLELVQRLHHQLGRPQENKLSQKEVRQMLETARHRIFDHAADRSGLTFPEFTKLLIR